MSASAPQSSLTGTVGVNEPAHETAQAPAAPQATAIGAAPHNGAPHNGSPALLAQASVLATEPTAPTAPTIPKPVIHANPHRKLIAGYMLLLFGTLLAFLIPTFHLHAGIGEAILVIISIAASVSAAAFIAYTFVRDAIRKL